jgi:hypothetical protein
MEQRMESRTHRCDGVLACIFSLAVICPALHSKRVASIRGRLRNALLVGCVETLGHTVCGWTDSVVHLSSETFRQPECQNHLDSGVETSMTAGCHDDQSLVFNYHIC